MTSMTLTPIRWSVAAVLMTAVSLAAAQANGGDSAGGNSDPKTPAAGTRDTTQHGDKKTLRKHKAGTPASAASAAASAPGGNRMPKDGGGKSNPQGGTR